MTYRIVSFALLALAAACVPARAANVAAFLRELTPLERVTEGQVVRAAAVFTGERQKVDDLAHCEARVRAAGLLSDGEAYDPKAQAQKGFAAILFARAMKLKGGWAGRVFGVRRRYGYKELEFLNMLPPMGERDPMTGAELFSLLRNAQDHVKERARDKAYLADYKKKRRERHGHGP